MFESASFHSGRNAATACINQANCVKMRSLVREGGNGNELVEINGPNSIEREREKEVLLGEGRLTVTPHFLVPTG